MRSMCATHLLCIGLMVMRECCFANRVHRHASRASSKRILKKTSHSNDGSLGFHAPRNSLTVSDFKNTEEFSTPRNSLSHSRSEIDFEETAEFHTPRNSITLEGNLSWHDALDTMQDKPSEIVSPKATVPLDHLDIQYSISSDVLEETAARTSSGDTIGLVDTDEEYCISWIHWPEWEPSLEPLWVFRPYVRTVSGMNEIGLVKYSIRGLPSKRHDSVSRRCGPDALKVHVENVYVNDQWKGLGNCKPLFYWAVKDIENSCQKDVAGMALTFAAFDDPLPACGCYVGAGSLLGFTQLSINGEAYPKQDHWASKAQIRSFCAMHFAEADGQYWNFRK